MVFSRMDGDFNSIQDPGKLISDSSDSILNIGLVEKVRNISDVRGMHSVTFILEMGKIIGLANVVLLTHF